MKKIEEMGVMPSLGHLIKISRALGVRVGTFLDDQEYIRPVLVRKGEEKSFLSFSTKDETSREHLNFFSLAQDKTGRHMEPFIVEIEPSKESDYKLSSHEERSLSMCWKAVLKLTTGKMSIFSTMATQSISIQWCSIMYMQRVTSLQKF